MSKNTYINCTKSENLNHAHKKMPPHTTHQVNKIIWLSFQIINSCNLWSGFCLYPGAMSTLLRRGGRCYFDTCWSCWWNSGWTHPIHWWVLFVLFLPMVTISIHCTSSFKMNVVSDEKYNLSFWHYDCQSRIRLCDNVYILSRIFQEATWRIK